MDLLIVYSPVGGGHKAAAMATLEAARARGLSAEVLDLFALAPKIVGKSYVRAHLTGQNTIPELYGSAYFAARGEATTSLPFTAGFARGTTKPFYVATRGLGHVDLRLEHPPRRRSVHH